MSRTQVAHFAKEWGGLIGAAVSGFLALMLALGFGWRTPASWIRAIEAQQKEHSGRLDAVEHGFRQQERFSCYLDRTAAELAGYNCPPPPPITLDRVRGR